MDMSELLNDKDNYGCTALHYSSIEGFALATDMLIKNGARVFTRTNNKDTPLHFAARYTQTSIQTDCRKRCRV